MAMAPISPAPEDLPDERSGDEISGGDIEAPTVLYVNDSDSSYSDEENAGYELLPQDIENEVTSMYTENFTQGNSEVEEPTRFALPAPTPECKPTEISFCSEEKDVHPMDEDHIQKIKAAMAGFTLPTSSVPHWAYVVSEEEWKTQLISGIQSKKKQSTQEKTDSKNEICENSSTCSFVHEESNINPEADATGSGVPKNS